MEIANKETYFNSIFEAVVVNTDSNQDPELKGRIQIYIPSLQFRYANLYEAYINSGSKSDHPDRAKFPWAITTVENLKEGDIVYGNTVDNTMNTYIILAKSTDTSDSINSSSLLSNSSQVLDLAMPIILQNEVGIELADWPDSIPLRNYTSINAYDNGGWSIGLIQWHHTRAYDLCYAIAIKDYNWEDRFIDKNLSLYNDLKSSIAIGNTINQRSSYQSSYHPVNLSLVTSIRNLLGSEVGKQVQREEAQSATLTSINLLQSDPYNIQNPALLIFLADIMNQYGNGISSKTKAAEINKNSNSIMQQLEEFRVYWDKQTGGNGTFIPFFRGQYHSRRDKTYQYIAELDKQGKLNYGNLCDIVGKASTSNYIPEMGEYLWPCPNSDQINCYYGTYAMQQQAANKYNGIYYWNKIMHKSAHGGIDIAPAKCGVDGDPVIACGGGIVTKIWDTPGASYGYGIMIKMNKNPEHSFVYGHFCKPVTLSVGDTVKAGQIIGYMGTTGNSTGTHLHFELRIGEVYSTNNLAFDPLPYLGKKAYA